MPELTSETTPEEQLLQAVKAILAYEGMTEFIAAGDTTSAYGILTADLAELKSAVDAIEAKI
ncbi:hypothetical protein N5C66_06325 [Rhizobium pusense]|uniref:hypothetical protein n=1 Tax=Agrobacterium pusense TaxID=648995 RepID=UPI00244C6926|nr:hypothetical protein [Agrobacterium pusense]MDH1094732.1 hypothetical protein [Agrobacterium pusense]MDH1111343.1 hypothetical protein [Agrobacterium pusense]MDH2192712.1 hypothetical protein [Agrobacterium pusense]